MQFNQTNNNAGDVNNAVSGTGNVVQSVGNQNKLQVDHKDGFLSALWKKVKAAAKWIFGSPS